MVAKALEIDLRGKGLEEVMKLLKDNGFAFSCSRTTMWDDPEGIIKDGPPVYVIWMTDGECPLLTVTDSNGKKKTLESGMDLHSFDRPPGGPAGQDWSAIRSLDVMR